MIREILAIVAGACLAGAVAAAEPAASFKRVKPPAPGAKRLITIAVEPAPTPERVLDRVIELAPEAPAAKRVPAGAAPDRGGPAETAWFWRRISPARADARPGRLDEALTLLASEAARAEGLAPDRAAMERIVARYGPGILAATAGTRISPALVAAIIAVESGGRADAVSPAGARGLMQLMPATAARFDVAAPFDPDESLRGGIAYLEFLLDRFDGDAVLALAGYNAGEGAVDRNGGVPDYAETRAYVPKVVAAWSVARRLCTRPPIRATDGCLFRDLGRVARGGSG